MGIETSIQQRLLENQVYHRVVTGVFKLVKRIIYSEGTLSGKEIAKKMSDIRDDFFGTISPLPWTGELRSKGLRRMEKLWMATIKQIETAIDEIIEKQPLIGPDGLIHSAIPLVVEQRLNGPIIGIEGPLNADVYLPDGAIVDIRTDRKRRFHRLSVVACAIVAESIYETPIDTGCIIYCSFDKSGEPTFEYETFMIDDNIRRDFIETRNTIMEIVEERRDPGLPETCYDDCPYYQICNGRVPVGKKDGFRANR